MKLLPIAAAALLSLSTGITAAETFTQDAYARAQVMVDVGGRRLNLFCMGSGSPTVVFEAGGGRPGWDWHLVQSGVAKRTRACIYDRAGMGFSDPISRPATAANAAKDLAFLLKNGRVPGPYVLVANSYGGMVAQLFARRPKSDVAGLVLLDAQHEDELVRVDKLTKGGMSGMYATIVDMDRACLAAAEKGFVPGSDLEKQCVSGAEESFGPKLAAAEEAMKRKASYWRANVSEAENMFTTSADQMRAARSKPFGDLPVVSLTRGVSPFLIPGQPQSDVNKAVEAENKAMQDETAALSTRGSNRVAEGALHAIHLSKPQAVVDAVMQVLDAVK
ncbi:alpha/beta hydrolase [Pseudoduganella ginsengisoli]|uniref:Alpha/beta fold hydrolase n=1 Tax=Pseudoduganella ginsengisoli TaxID=1462440 RepID=A0A6L6Q1V9_9BURK|nr:alpha/beta hydrolase [Pseudoduganella ginsengisoli]MTW03419.1 alpha/beta fold hydrolase [Pseudoduganella ginsengisoli]